jgi:hypothetical protein
MTEKLAVEFRAKGAAIVVLNIIKKRLCQDLMVNAL